MTALTITSVLPTAVVGQPYQVLLQAIGGVPPYDDWFIGEVLPDDGWQVCTPDGLLTGIPTVARSAVQVAIGLRDSATPVANTTQVILPLAVVNPTIAVPDYTGLITSEHNQRPNFVALVNLLANGAGAITEVLESFTAAFDLDTATGAQLDVLGQWIGASRTVFGVLTLPHFGFSDDPEAEPFGEVGNPSIGAPWLEQGQSGTSNSSLPDLAYRIVLQAKIITNQFNGTIGQLEQALTILTGVPYQIIDPGNLNVTMVLLGFVSGVVQQLLTGFDLLPRVAGVTYEFLFPIASYTWTLQGSAHATGQSANKQGGVMAWDSAAALSPTVNLISLTFTMPALAAIAGGLAASVLAGPSYTALNFGFFLTAAGEVEVTELGAITDLHQTYAPGDTFQVVSDGKYINYLHNQQIVRTTTWVGGPFNGMINFFTPNASVINITEAIN